MSKEPSIIGSACAASMSSTGNSSPEANVIAGSRSTSGRFERCTQAISWIDIAEPGFHARSNWSRSAREQALIHHNAGKLKTKPFGEFLHAYRELLKLKARDFHNRSVASLHQTLPPTYQSELNGWTKFKDLLVEPKGIEPSTS